MPADAELLLGSAMRRVAWDYPLHGRLLARMVLRPDPTVRRIGLSLDASEISLTYDPDYVARSSLDHCTGLIVHIVNHVIFGHLEMDAAAFPDAAALVVAVETTANEHVHPALLPIDSLLIDGFALPPDEDTHTRYGRLEGNMTAAEEAGASDVDELADGPATLDDHSGWNGLDAEMAGAIARGMVEDAYAALSEAEQDKLDAAVKRVLSRVIGSRAGTAAEKISPRRGRVQWRRQLSVFVSSAMATEASMSWPSRRAPELVGVVPGRRAAAARPRLMIAIDTSGSLTDDLLALIYGELRVLQNLCEMIVVQCDAQIQSIAPFDGTLPDVLGRGGTDLRPPFEASVIRRIGADGIIYFTDGLGPAPELPPRIPVLWCLTAGGERPASWGRAVWMT